MDISFLLHLYQPSTQEETTFRQIYANCYEPLLKLLKDKRNISINLNISLSLLEMMDKYGYYSWISSVKDLVNSDRIELTGSAAYHPLLTKVSPRIVLDEIILNEYGVGYYLGSQHGFDGEPSIMIKDLVGFFPPELALSGNVISSLSELGYKWTLADESIISVDDISYDPNEIVTGAYLYKESKSEFIIVVRDSKISNILAFKRDSDISDILTTVQSYQPRTNNLFIALDGETFGHHNSNGVLLLDLLLDSLVSAGHHVTTVSNNISLAPLKSLHIINESTWAISRKDISEGNKDCYKYWDGDKAGIQKDLRSLEDLLSLIYEDVFSKFKEIPGMETAKIWQLIDSSFGSNELLSIYMLIHKTLQSDKYWWLSREIISDSELYDISHAMKICDYYSNVALALGTLEQSKSIKNFASALEKFQKKLSKQS